MPAWVMHLKTALEVNKTLKLDKNLFLFGNVMADAEKHIINNLSITIPYDLSHYATKQDIGGLYIKLPDSQNFLDNHRNHLRNEVVVGYLTHILTDYFWNELTYGRYFIHDDYNNAIGVKLVNNDEYVTDRDTIRVLKHQDFETYSRKIYTDLDVNIKNDDLEVIYNKCKDIWEIPYNIDDIKKIVNYINNIKEVYSKKDGNEFEYHIYTEAKFDKYFNKSVSYILGKLKNYLAT